MGVVISTIESTPPEGNRFLVAAREPPPRENSSEVVRYLHDVGYDVVYIGGGDVCAFATLTMPISNANAPSRRSRRMSTRHARVEARIS